MRTGGLGELYMQNYVLFLSNKFVIELMIRTFSSRIGNIYHGMSPLQYV